MASHLFITSFGLRWLKPSPSNRHGQLPYHGSHTRVILIEGPDEVMTIPAWASYLQRFSIFQLEHARKVECFKLGRTMIELRFARIDGQAEACFLALERNAVSVGKSIIINLLDP